MTRIIYVRHGQTEWNSSMRYQGHTNVPLDETGRKQAKAAAKRFANMKIDAVYASNLDRAFETASIIAEGLQLPVQSVPAFREICFGEWEGLTYNEIHEHWPKLLEGLYSTPGDLGIPGGESFEGVQRRATHKVSELVAAHPDQTILVVSHGGTLRTILSAALHLNLNYIWNIRQDNTAVNMIDYYGERTIVSLVNDTSHLQ